MARRRRRYRTSRRRSSYRPRRRSSSSGGLGTQLLGAGVYGVGRGYLAKIVEPMMTKVLGNTLGSVADNVGMLGANYILHRFIKNNMVRKVTKAGMLIEAAQIGQELAAGKMTLDGSNTSNEIIY